MSDEEEIALIDQMLLSTTSPRIQRLDPVITSNSSNSGQVLTSTGGTINWQTIPTSTTSTRYFSPQELQQRIPNAWDNWLRATGQKQRIVTPVDEPYNFFRSIKLIK